MPLLTHRLATADDEETTGWLDDVVLMVVACLNPDGMDMVVRYYRDTLGTPYEGASMPGLYHHFVGHDNNRDFLALNLAESRAVSRVFSTEWFPQVLVDKHQMGRTGPRYFVPRYHDPIAENIDAKLWIWSDVFGSAMARAMGDLGQNGIASNWVFDEYWPGATTTSHWKGVISLLTEAASCRVATPVFVEKNERRVRGKGLSEYKKSVNMPDPWPGGWWRLGDIVAYELASWRGIIATASMLREDILGFRNDACREEVERGRTQPPFYYVIPHEQHEFVVGAQEAFGDGAADFARGGCNGNLHQGLLCFQGMRRPRRQADFGQSLQYSQSLRARKSAPPSPPGYNFAAMAQPFRPSSGLTLYSVHSAHSHRSGPAEGATAQPSISHNNGLDCASKIVAGASNAL